MMAPMRKAASAQSQGMRKAGTMNMQKPVAMPIGGMTIFFSVTADWPSLMRQMMITTAPKADAMAYSRGVMWGMQEPQLRRNCGGQADAGA
jgi:hypothetical protein